LRQRLSASKSLLPNLLNKSRLCERGLSGAVDIGLRLINEGQGGEKVTERYIHCDGLLDGERVVIDRRTGVVLPEATFNSLEPYVRPDGKPSLIKYMIDLDRDETLDPYEVMKKSRDLLGSMPQLPNKLTVGDLSWESAQKKKSNAAWAANKVNMNSRLTVGDLSVCR